MSNSAGKEPEASFYCFECGSKLVEVGLGFMECTYCKSQYLPFINRDEKNQCIEQVKKPEKENGVHSSE